MAEELPSQARLLCALVNTCDLESGKDAIGDPADLQAWLRERGLPGATGAPSADDVARFAHLREGIRSALAPHQRGLATDEQKVAALDALASEVPLSLRFDGDNDPRLVPRATGLDAAIGEILAAVVTSVADGTWEKLKICRADSCRWAFYDTSKNHSRSWCSMDVCGNREKAKRYRARARASS